MPAGVSPNYAVAEEPSEDAAAAVVASTPQQEPSSHSAAVRNEIAVDENQHTAEETVEEEQLPYVVGSTVKLHG